MAVLVGGHLSQSEHGVAALEAVVVRLLVGVRTGVDATRLRRSEFFKSGRQDRIRLLVLASVSHHFVRVRAHKVALEAVKVRRLVLHCTCAVKFALIFCFNFFRKFSFNSGRIAYLNWLCRGIRVFRTPRWPCTAGSLRPLKCRVARDEPCAFHPEENSKLVAS